MVKVSSKQKIVGKGYRFTVLTPQLIRMEYSKENFFIDEQTQVIQNREFPEFEFELEEKNERLEIDTEAFHLTYDKKAFTSQGLVITMKSNFTDYNNKWYYGQQVNTLKGTVRTLDNVDGEIELEEGIISRQGYAILDDSTSFIVSTKGLPKSKQVEHKDIYFFGYQHEYKKALKDYFKLTGATPILPRYALGNWWSRFWAYTDQEYLALMDRFKKEEIPLSVSVIDMDWHLRDIPSRFGSGWTGYSWNRKLFPQPAEFLEKLHERVLRVTLNVHPADGIRAFEDCYPKVADRLKLNVLLEESAEFDMTSQAFVESYFKDVHHPLEQQGVDFWWIDWQQGEQSKEDGLDPLWLLNQYHFEDNNKTKDGLILSRYAGPGSHRYPVGFSGDSIISWESLQFQPYFTATASNIGYSWWSHDIGGHMGGKRDDELTLRWMQFGIYSPINRLHSSSSPFNGKEPWNFPPMIEEAMKESLRERHRILPYLYTANVELSEQGSPLLQPMYYENPEKDAAYNYKNQYYFGNELLVVPIVHPTDKTYKFSKEDIWLPEGKWYDYHNGYRYEGDTEISIFRKINESAVFVRGGAIIPTAADFLTTKPDELPKVIEWKVFPGQSGEYHLIEEKEGKRCTTSFKLDWENLKVTIAINGELSIIPSDRSHRLILHCVEAGDGSAFPENIFRAEIVEHLSLPVKEIDKQMMTDMLFERIDLPEISYDLKNQLWEILADTTDFKNKLLTVKCFKDEQLTDLLTEVFYIEES
ncbi:TPA: TIM-barrel domain-containing protein [Enterococcus faecalis]